jgi:lantibiotic modifying enzyme
MRESIIRVLNRIDSELNYNNDFLGLMSGHAGSSLFKYFYTKHFNNQEYDDFFITSLNLLVENSPKLLNSTFAGGRSGINWFFCYLFKQDLITLDDLELMTSDDILLSASALEYLKNDNYDFLHGSLGIAHYLKYQKNKKLDFFFDDLFLQLNILIQKGGDILPLYDIRTSTLDLKNSDLGLAHGVISVLKFCIDCFKEGICRVQAYALSQKIITFIKSSIFEIPLESYFPSQLGPDFEPHLSSGMGWCYGDLIIGYTLLEGARVFNDTPLKKFALKILQHSNTRRDYNSTYVNNPAFCHGSSGIAHIFNKLWHKTGDVSFKRSCDFWIRNTIDYYNDNNFDNGLYKTYNYKSNPALLTGEAGIGLVLLSYLTEDFSWDYCLMLN